MSAFAVDTESRLGGVVSGFIKKDKSPYMVTETIVVPEDKALVVEAGVEFRFAAETGIDVRGGSLAIVGEANNPVTLTAADGSLWNGISITGVKRTEVQGVHLSNAEFGFAVESGALEIRDAVIENTRRAAVFVKNSSVDIQWSKLLNNQGAGIWTGIAASVNVEGSVLAQNEIALVAGEEASINLRYSRLMENKIAILDAGDNTFKQRNTIVIDNEVALVSADLPSESIKQSLEHNKKDLQKNVAETFAILGDEPENVHADNTKILKVENAARDSVWEKAGHIGMGMGYHLVTTRHNHSHEDYISNSDTVAEGERYKNYFQTPGAFAYWTANLAFTSPEGETFEFAGDLTSDRWNRLDVRFLQAAYTDERQKIIVGDLFANAGELYLNGINLFGGLYELGLFKNAADEPLFVGTAFAGEYKAPVKEGSRNPSAYNDYTEDGEAEAQTIVVGGKLRWNMHRRFNGTLGFVGSKDLLDDPLLRDGMSENTNTASPLVTSRTFFADGNWLVYPGDIKLNGQVSVGSADTANAAKIRAVNREFASAGLDASNFALLNKLMKNPNEVNRLTSEQLESIFGENVQKTDREKREELRRVLERAREVAKKDSKDDEVKPNHKDFWNYEHWAVAGSYQWSNANTFIEGYLRYVGSEYYSAGSPDLLQNSRMVGGNFRQNISDFWKFGFGYEMNVENAADTADGYNIFGMGEGTQWGMFSGAEDEWLKKHEQDENRTLYIHDAYVNNEFKLNDRISMLVKYAVNYRTRSTNQRLYSNYSLSSGIYDDPWFNAVKGKPVMQVVEDGDTVEIDSVRWAKYYALSDEEYLATQFNENLLKNIVELGFVFKLPKNVLRVSGAWTFRNDLSKFEQDDLIEDLDFKDETFGILGYHFHGGDYFEQRYPVSLTTQVGGFRNVLAVVPRYKIYNRNEMREFEWALAENMTIPLSEDFLDLNLTGNIRQNFLNYEIDNEKFDEMELDVDAIAALTVHHSPRLYTIWTLGAIFNYRPDSRADEYRDLYGMVSLNYEF
ncbi:MAG: right-handed parallel beta-helix repeat-containing protein [Fibrobacter sp.]|nr:right-handed parallel beta-helix repeat-containing protein [Fibrobacter sp.]